MVCPLSLTLEACADSVVTEHFLFKAFGQILVSSDKISDYKVHLDGEFPLFFLLLGSELDSSFFAEEINKIGIVISSLFAMLFCPRQSALIILFIIYAFLHTAKYFNLVDGLYAHTEIFFNKLLVDYRPADTHTHGADLEITLAAHFGSGNSRTTEAEQLFFYIIGNIGNVAYVLNLVTVKSECRQPLLCVSCKNRSKINRAGTFSAVEAPNAFDCRRIHIHCLRTVAPTRCYRKRNCDIFFLELLCTSSSFGNTTDGCVCHYNLDGCTVRITKVFFKQFFCGFRHCPDLRLKAFTKLHRSSASVDYWANTYYGIRHNNSSELYIFYRSNFLASAYLCKLYHTYFHKSTLQRFF